MESDIIKLNSFPTAKQHKRSKLSKKHKMITEAENNILHVDKNLKE